MIYHYDKQLRNARTVTLRCVHYVFDLLQAGLYAYARKRSEFPPPFRRTTLRWVLMKRD